MELASFSDVEKPFKRGGVGYGLKVTIHEKASRVPVTVSDPVLRKTPSPCERGI
jgi:hypothetical protein